MITVGIPAYREEKNIAIAVERILNEKINDMEIIVVCPDDETAEAVKRINDERIKLIKEKEREGKPSAINKILKNANGEIIVFTDGDLLINKGAIEKLIEPFKDENVGATCGRPIVKNKNNDMFGFWGNFLYDIAHRRRMKDPNHITTNLCAVRNGIISEIPKEALIDDYVIGISVLESGYKIAYVPSAKVYVNFPTSLKDFLLQRKRTFAGYMQIKDWYGKKTRNLASEVKEGFWKGVKYCKSIKEFFYFISLCFWRAIAWMMAFYDYKIKRKKLIQIWERIESTKK